MSTTIETQQPAQPTTGTQTPPELTILSRVASIPMIHSGLEVINGTLSSNAYTSSTYATAKELSSSAYKLTEPLQIKLAPLISTADGYANKAVDAIESRYPYPFKAKPEDVVEYVRERKETASQYVTGRIGDANKTLDERVRSPAFSAAQDLDQRLTPLVNYFETTISRLNPSESEPGPSSPDPQYQYQRALALSKTLKDNVYVYTAEQLKHIQAQSVIVQRASETAQSITTLASSSFTNAQSRVHNLSENMLSELQKLQTQTNTLSASIQSSIQASKDQLQNQVAPQIQATYVEISAVLSATIADFNEILKKKDTPLPEKVSLVGKEVRERVTPILETIKNGVTEILSRTKAGEAAPETETPTPTPVPNGEAPSSSTNDHAAPKEEN